MSYPVAPMEHRSKTELGKGQCPTASAPRVRVSAAPTRPSGITMIDGAEVNGAQTLTLWPRASSALAIAADTPGSIIVSSGSH